MHKSNGKARRGQWLDDALQMAIDGLDKGYKMIEVCSKYAISRSLLKDHYAHRTRQRKVGSKIVLTKDKEEKLVDT